MIYFIFKNKTEITRNFTTGGIPLHQQLLQQQQQQLRQPQQPQEEEQFLLKWHQHSPIMHGHFYSSFKVLIHGLFQLIFNFKTCLLFHNLMSYIWFNTLI